MQNGEEGPRIVRRKCGGWLAISGASESLKIGVTAESEEGARERFADAVAAWERTLALDTAPAA